MSDLPELRPNQIGVSCKTYGGGVGPAFKMEDETLYFTINKDSVAMELYPKKPVIIIDRDAIKMILNKIGELEKSVSPEVGKETANNLNSDQFPLDINQEDEAITAGADSNKLNDLKDNGEVAAAVIPEGNKEDVEAGKAAILSESDKLSAHIPDKDGIFI